MSQISVGKLLPNLKVTLGNNDEIDDDSSDERDSMAVDSNVEIVRPNIDNLINPKVYINKDGGFATGIDLLEEETSGILSKRAERFGLEVEEDKPSISSLYESMGIDIKNRESAKMRHIRLDAIHVRGVEEFNTEEVFNYFQDYGPSSIEWINDSCCNILWFDETSSARALLGLSKPLPDVYTPEILKIMNGSDEPEASSSKLKDKTEREEMEVDSSSDVEVNIPVPPGRWRIGLTHSKAKTILMRYATTADKKVPGAEKRSKFYKKYGNPNYGGLKGLISSSRKHKTQVAANRWAVEKSSSHQPSSSISIPKASKKKLIRMRMYADDEELKTKKIRSKGSQKKGNVHSRLGKKYTAEDLCRLGNYRDYDDHRVNRQGSYRDYDYPQVRRQGSYRDYDDPEVHRQGSSRDYDYPEVHRQGSSRDYDYPQVRRQGSYRDYDDPQVHRQGSSRDYDDHRGEDRDYGNNFNARSSSLDLRSKLKNKKNEYKRETHAGPSSRSSNREEGAFEIKQYKRVEDLKKERRSFYKRKHRSPLCADDDDEDDDDEESSSSEY